MFYELMYRSVRVHLFTDTEEFAVFYSRAPVRVVNCVTGKINIRLIPECISSY